ncbi:MAG TPA: hypothetical protein VFO73_10160 [Candidatus Limnocylindrales bacterium]|nr:hypothetical protein [Candidatus Limnocylindrales bacterium]
MRLRWPFGRSTAAEDGNTTDPGADRQPPDAGTTDGGRFPAPPAGPPAWSSLPPIQRVVGSVPLVAPAEPFLAAVPGAHPLPPIVEPLGHDVTTVAPTGLVAAPAHGVPSLTSHADLVPRPVQRRAATAAEPIEDATMDFALSLAVPANAGRSGSAVPDEPADASTAAAPTPGTSEAPPASRQLAVVAPAATVRPSERPLTRAEAPVALGAAYADRPLVARRTNVPTAPTTAAASPAPRSAASAPAGSAPSGSAPNAPEPVTGERPRRGIGAPLPAAPITAVPPSLARPFPTSDAAAATSPTIPARGFGPTMRSGTSRGTTNPTTGAAPLRTTIQRRSGGPPAADVAEPGIPGYDGATQVPGDAAQAATPPPGASRPLPTLQVLRPVHSATGGAMGADADTAPLAMKPGAAGPGLVVPASSRAASSSTPPLRRPLAGSQAIGSLPPTQRSADNTADEAADADSPSPTAVRAPSPLTTGTFDDASPGGSPAWARSGQAAAPATTRASSGPAVSRPEGVMTLAHPASTASAPSSLGTTTSAPLRLPTVARSITAASSGARASAPAPATPAPAPAPVLAPTATAVVQRVDGAAPPAPSEGSGTGGHSDDELDDLARALFGRFRTRLRNEFIYEREAKGLTFDS